MYDYLETSAKSFAWTEAEIVVASICAAVATLLAIVWWFIQKHDARRKKYKDAKRDKQKAIDAHDFNAQLDADRRMQLYK